jgi:hypothetical protein
MRNPILFPAIVLLLFPILIRAADMPNRLEIGTDQSLVYRRTVTSWLLIGTDVKYEIFAQAGDNMLHKRSQASFWLLTMTASIPVKGFRIDNTLRFLNNEKFPSRLGYALDLSRELPISESIIFLPTLRAADYYFDMDPDPSNWEERTHNFRFVLGPALVFEYRF